MKITENTSTSEYTQAIETCTTCITELKSIMGAYETNTSSIETKLSAVKDYTGWDDDIHTQLINRVGEVETAIKKIKDSNTNSPLPNVLTALNDLKTALESAKEYKQAYDNANYQASQTKDDEDDKKYEEYKSTARSKKSLLDGQINKINSYITYIESVEFGVASSSSDNQGSSGGNQEQTVPPTFEYRPLTQSYYEGGSVIRYNGEEYIILKVGENEITIQNLETGETKKLNNKEIKKCELRLEQAGEERTIDRVGDKEFGNMRIAKIMDADGNYHTYQIIDGVYQEI